MAGPVLLSYLDQYIKSAQALRREKNKPSPDVDKRAQLARMTKYYHECFEKRLNKAIGD